MSEAFLKVVNMSISAGWLVLVVLALRLILKKAPKWGNVLLWGIVAIRLISPFSIVSAVSLIPSRETISPEIMMDWTPEISTGIATLDQAVNPVISTSFAPNPGDSANPLQILIPVAANLWLLGVVILMAYTAISYLTLRRKIRTAVILRDNIFQCETVSSPFVLGIFDPRIYLPYTIDGKNLDHVIAHELAHIRRFDHWWKPLGFLLLTIYWFNPLVWVAYILLCRDIELACDEKVIAKLGSEQRADYTQALVTCAVNRRMITACPLAFGEVGVKDRVKSIMNYRKPTFWIIMTALAVCVVVAVCFLTDPIQITNEYSYLNYKNAISFSRRQDVIPAIHYSSENDQGSIGIGMVEGIAFSEYLDEAKWYEKRLIPSDLSSPGSIAVNVAENLRITVYDRNFAAVKFNNEVCYYRIANDDYEKMLNMLMPADEERLKNSSEIKLDLAPGFAAIDNNTDRISFGVNDLDGENTKENLSEIAVEDPLDLETSSGVGVEIAFESEDMLVFYGDFGLFGYDLKTNEFMFSVDFVKAVGIEGNVQGSYGTAVDVSEDGNTVVISEYTVETETRGKTCYIDIPSMTYEHGEYESIENPFNKENIRGSVYPGIKISQKKYTLDGKEWSLFE